MKSGKVLVVDDDVAIEKMLRPYLTDAGFVTCSASNGSDAIATVEREHPDVILLDLQMPGRSGLEVLGELRRLKTDAFVILLTARADEVDRVVGLEMGADDYVTKPFSPREVASRVKAVLRRRSIGKPGASANGAQRPSGRIVVGELALDATEHSVRMHGKEIALTPTEFRILEMLAAEPGRVFSRTELLDRINADSLEVGERSLDSHVAHLRAKIEPRLAKPRYIVTVYGFGYKFNRPGVDAEA